MMETWLIIGATSSMARAFARKVAIDGHSVVVVGRDVGELSGIKDDCLLRGAPVAEALPFDARDRSTHAAILDLMSRQEGILNAVSFVGSMPPQDAIDADPSLIEGVIADSFTGPAELLQGLAPLMEDRGSGTIVGVGSVAGDRGRIGNYVYGAAKAGFHTYLSGLRNRLTRAGGHVVTVKPGFVDTAMTYGLEGMFLVASPDDIAQGILKAVAKKRNVVYLPWFWWGIMTIIRHVPEPIFKKMSI